MIPGLASPSWARLRGAELRQQPWRADDLYPTDFAEIEQVPVPAHEVIRLGDDRVSDQVVVLGIASHARIRFGQRLYEYTTSTKPLNECTCCGGRDPGGEIGSLAQLHVEFVYDPGHIEQRDPTGKHKVQDCMCGGALRI